MSYLSEKLWELPTTWTWATMGDVAQVIGGGTPSTTNPENFNGDIPWITPADMSSHVGKSISKGGRSISQRGLADSGARWIAKGAILFSSRAPIGYVAIASRPVTTNQGFKSFIPEDGITSDFVYYWLTNAKPFAEKLASGTTFLEISGAKAALIPFPVAPFSEQVRIVAKLEELLSDLDAGIAEIKAAQKKLLQYRQSLLKAAMDGMLSAEWRNRNHPAETGEQLLERILTERRSRWEANQLAKFSEQGKKPPTDWCERYPEPVHPDISDLPELPKGWVWASMDMLSELQGGIQKQPSRMPVSNKYPFLRVANVARGVLKLDEIHEIELFSGELQRLALQKGDLLIVEGNGSLTEIGRCALWDGSIPNAVHQNHLIRARPIGMCNEFVEAWLNSIRGIEKLAKSAATTSGLYTLSIRKIARIPVPVAPLEEQIAVVDMFTPALEEQERQTAAAQLSLNQTAAQRKNILKAAFTGKLLPQNPNDEPASTLLGEIQAKRAAREKPKKSNPIKKHGITKMLDASTLKEWVSNYPEDEFTFENIQSEFNTSYETLKDIVFFALSENQPVFKQTFDTVSGMIKFRKIKS